MIQIFVTGGTFDKQYNYLSGGLYFEESHLPQMLDRGRNTNQTSMRTLMMVDSLDMKDEHRAVIALNCQEAETDKIIITHGTDRMVETAKYLAEKNISEKTIVLTGAMVPYAFGTSSDGFFNLGSAMAFVQLLEPGVYVVMNGRYFAWDKVRKNTDTGYFEEIN